MAAAMSNYGFRVRAGGTTVAHAPDGSAVTSFDLGGGFTRRTFSFETDDAPPAGPISIELLASSLIGAASAVVFDNVRLESEAYTPVRLTAIGRVGETAHVIHADVLVPCAGALPHIVSWTDQQ